MTTPYVNGLSATAGRPFLRGGFVYSCPSLEALDCLSEVLVSLMPIHFSHAFGKVAQYLLGLLDEVLSGLQSSPV